MSIIQAGCARPLNALALAAFFAAFSIPAR